jgi:hypothetical protein
MPSTEYFRRQSDICLRLALIASSEEVATRLIAMAQDYHAQADALEAQSNRSTRLLLSSPNRHPSSPASAGPFPVGSQF